MFITENDLYTKIRQSDLKQIIGTDDTIVNHALATAQATASSIIGKKYDIDALTGAEGDKREPILVSTICDIAIYEIVALAQPNIDLTDRRERAQQATLYLKDIASGEYPMPWPLKQLDTIKQSTVIHGGTTSRGNYF